MKSVDLSNHKVIAMREIEDAGRSGATEIIIGDGGIITPAARDSMQKYRMSVRNGGGNGSSRPAGGAPAGNAALERLFNSPEAQKIKEEICAVGRKLWQRQYVDGNGGNISHRIGENEVICTPTLVSKADLRPEDLCMVDLEGNQLAGSRPRTSEILLHLEIYKAVPQAKSVVHCHPPHATAYAITGRVPPTGIIPEYEIFVGTVAVSPYETPGTKIFAETVLPYARHHNTILLANHGVVCWADTVTHAEWYVEVVDTYCWTIMLSQQLGAPLTRIPQTKASDLLELKRKMGLPDARYEMKECELADMPEPENAYALPPATWCQTTEPSTASPDEVEAMVQAVTDAVLAAIDNSSERKR